MKKCSSKKHVFNDSNRKCECGKADIWWFECARCGVNNVCKVHGSICEKCLNSKAYKKEIEEFNRNYKRRSVKTYREAVAFGHDKKTGQPVAIDKKGRRFDPMQTRYAKHENDPHGWKATDKVPNRKYIVS